MPLKKCPECNNAVSNTAATCPHCGYQFRTVNYSKPSPKPTYHIYDSRASKTIERDLNIKCIIGLIGSIVGIIAAIVFIVLAFVGPKEPAALFWLALLCGLAALIVSIFGLVWYIYRLKTY